MSELPTKEELRVKKHKEAIVAMRSAKDNMKIALTRIDSLEGVIANLSALVDEMMNFVPEKVYPYGQSDNYRKKFKDTKESWMKYV